MKFWKLVVVTMALVLSANVKAALVSIDADDFAVGTNIENAWAGVTLSVFGREDAEVLSTDSFDSNPFLNRNMATTGTRIIGNTPALSSVIPSGQIWDEATFGLLRIDFDVATDFVSIDLIYGDDGIGNLSAYDVNGNLLNSVTGQGDGRGESSALCPPFCDLYTPASIQRNSADIAYILAGGVGAEPVYLDNMQYNVVPVPAAVWLFGSGLLGLVGFVRRKPNA